MIQGVQQQLQEAVLGAIKPLLKELCEAELTVKLGRGKREPRRVGGQAREIGGSAGIVGAGMRTTSREMGIIGAR